MFPELMKHNKAKFNFSTRVRSFCFITKKNLDGKKFQSLPQRHVFMLRCIFPVHPVGDNISLIVILFRLDYVLFLSMPANSPFSLPSIMMRPTWYSVLHEKWSRGRHDDSYAPLSAEEDVDTFGSNNKRPSARVKRACIVVVSL